MVLGVLLRLTMSLSVSLEKHIKLHHDDVTHIDLVALDDEVTEKYANTGRFSIRKVTFGRNGLYILDMKSKRCLVIVQYSIWIYKSGPRSIFTETGYSDFKGKGWMGGSAVIRTLFGFVNLYKIMDNPLPRFPH